MAWENLPSTNTPLNATNLLDNVYPVGSIYMSVNSTNPGTLFGGTWEAWGAGRVPVGIDTSDTDFDTVEETGGDKSFSSNAFATGTRVPDTGSSWINQGLKASITQSLLQPYIVCYMWKRTA